MNWYLFQVSGNNFDNSTAGSLASLLILSASTLVKGPTEPHFEHEAVGGRSHSAALCRCLQPPGYLIERER